MAESTMMAQTQRRTRIALFDNIKGLLIILVVAGHMMQPIHNDNPTLSTTFDIIYLFHMPLFVFMSGLFAKSTYRNGSLNYDRIISFAVLGIAYQAALLAVSSKDITLASMLRFASAPWYLIAMAWWGLLTPLLSWMGARRGMICSLVASFLWGLVDMEGGFLALSRMFAFLPCFALGYYLTPARVERAANSSWPWLAVFFAAIIVAARVASPHAYEWFFPLVYGDNPYGPHVAMGVVRKIAALGSGALLSVACIKLVPRSTSWLTVLGRRTLQVYIVHRLVRGALTFQTPFYGAPVLLGPVAGSVIIVVASLALTALCATPLLEPLANGIVAFPWRKKASRLRASVTRIQEALWSNQSVEL
ncbi:acyltransferase family protein [Collinsella stercoris]|uniref:acyltransferase family protein n=1 Tax=Collinsella stercoris TaxID=147206 RepID=UPI0002E3C32B|nr:acyltransferase family protein [Collinsella stercoris]UEA45325.1 acyltransferase family protein [Collinsella stercoris DSM 13279]UWP12150.1 acyltransferase family protein [Collinsella stercoris]